jgi:hypothetical protein
MIGLLSFFVLIVDWLRPRFILFVPSTSTFSSSHRANRSFA